MIWPSQNFKKQFYVVVMPSYGLLLSNQSEPSNVHKNWILWHLPLKNNICTPAVNHRWCLVILICASVRYCGTTQLSKSPLQIVSFDPLEEEKHNDGYFNNIESALLHPNNSVWAQNDPFCSQNLIVQCFSNHLVKQNTIWIGYVNKIPCIFSYFTSMAGMCF